MFHPVRVLNPKGKVKAIISEKELSQAYWDRYFNAEDSYNMVQSNSRQVPTWVKKRLDVEYSDLPERALGR
jgi:hypothetical protein